MIVVSKERGYHSRNKEDHFEILMIWVNKCYQDVSELNRSGAECQEAIRDNF